MSESSIVWLMLFVVFLIIEGLAPGLVSIWMAAGSLAALIASLCGGALWLQIVLFVVVSALTLLFTRPLVKKYINNRKQPTNADAVIGKECIVTEPIDNILGTGAVKTGGKTWTAVSFDDAVNIEKDARVTALEIRGVKLIVKPIVKE